MPAGIDVVELVGVEAEVAVGGEMYDQDDNRRASEEKDRLEDLAPLFFS
jgi:hypothetical protein